MFRHKFTEPVSVSVQIHWFVLAFLAGCVNVGGFLACQRFVSHVTGFATLAGVEFFEGTAANAFRILSIPAFFLVAAVLSGFLIESEPNPERRYRSYTVVMGAVALFLAAVLIGGEAEWFGVFGNPAHAQHSYVLQALLCGAAGLLNAAVTSSSGATVRVTHLTGLTTDLGLGISRALLRFRRGEPSLPWEVKVNTLRLISIVSFIIGSGVGAATFIEFEYLGFLLPMAVAFYVTIVSYTQIDKKDVGENRDVTKSAS